MSATEELLPEGFASVWELSSMPCGKDVVGSASWSTGVPEETGSEAEVPEAGVTEESGPEAAEVPKEPGPEAAEVPEETSPEAAEVPEETGPEAAEVPGETGLEAEVPEVTGLESEVPEEAFPIGDNIPAENKNIISATL